MANGFPVMTSNCKFFNYVAFHRSSSSCTVLYPKSNSCKKTKSSEGIKKSPWKHWNLFLLRFNLFNFLSYPKALKRTAGFTRVELEENKFDERLNSSKYLNSLRSSGNVTRLFPCRSSNLSFVAEYRFLILAGVIELYERLSTSSLGKSSLLN